MLVSYNNLICPITLEIAKEPVYFKTCAHAFDNNSITTWLNDKLRADNVASCPLCRHIYPLALAVNQPREEAITRLFSEILQPLLVPEDVNQFLEIIAPHLAHPEGDDFDVQPEDERAAQLLAAEHQARCVRLLVQVRDLSAENANFRIRNVELNDINIGLNNSLVNCERTIRILADSQKDLIRLFEQNAKQLQASVDAHNRTMEKYESLQNRSSLIYALSGFLGVATVATFLLGKQH